MVNPFFGIEPTKLTHTVINEAEVKFDKLIEDLAKNGQYNCFAMTGHHIHWINQVKLKIVSAYAQSLEAHFGFPDVIQVSLPNPSTLTCNAWKRMTTLKVTQENFSDLPMPPCHHINKKQCTENGSNDATAADDDNSLSPPSLSMTKTALTDERTEFQSSIANLQTSFMKAFNDIKGNGDKCAQEFEAQIKEAEQAYVNAQMTMLSEFKLLTEKYTTVLESFSSLHSDVCKAQLV
jgi:hypothetical protein